MRDLIEALQTELFGFGRDKKKGPPSKFGKAVNKMTAKHAMKTPKKHPYLAKQGGQHLAARSRLARMKLKKRSQART
jgi:hypothetical protein